MLAISKARATLLRQWVGALLHERCKARSTLEYLLSSLQQIIEEGPEGGDKSDLRDLLMREYEHLQDTASITFVQTVSAGIRVDSLYACLYHYCT